jgi:hypothetical protein
MNAILRSSTVDHHAATSASPARAPARVTADDLPYTVHTASHQGG